MVAANPLWNLALCLMLIAGVQVDAEFCKAFRQGTFEGQIVTVNENVDGATKQTSDLSKNVITAEIRLQQKTCSKKTGAAVVLQAIPKACSNYLGDKGSDCLAAYQKLPFERFGLALLISPDAGLVSSKLQQIAKGGKPCNAECEAGLQTTLDLYARALDLRFVAGKDSKQVLGQGQASSDAPAAKPRIVPFKQNSAHYLEANANGDITLSKAEYVEALSAANASQVTARGTQLFASSKSVTRFQSGSTLAFSGVTYNVLLPVNKPSDEQTKQKIFGYINIKVSVQLNVAGYEADATLVNKMDCQTAAAVYPQEYIQLEMQYVAEQLAAFKAASINLKTEQQSNSNEVGGRRKLNAEVNKNFFSFNQVAQTSILGKNVQVAGASGSSGVKVSTTPSSITGQFDFGINAMVFGNSFSVTSLQVSGTANTAAAVSGNGQWTVGGISVWKNSFAKTQAAASCDSLLPNVNSVAWNSLYKKDVDIWGASVKLFGLISVSLRAGVSFEAKLAVMTCSEAPSGGFGGALLGSLYAAGSASSGCFKWYCPAGAKVDVKLTVLQLAGAYGYKAPLTALVAAPPSTLCEFKAGSVGVLSLYVYARANTFFLKGEATYNSNPIIIWSGVGWSCNSPPPLPSPPKPPSPPSPPRPKPIDNCGRPGRQICP